MAAMRIALPERVCAAALRRCDPARSSAVLSGEALGTTWRVRFAAIDPPSLPRLRGRIEARLRAVVADLSQWEPSSALSAFNHAPAGRWVAVPPDLATVVAAGLEIAGRTGGAFDPTHGRASGLLGFGAQPFAGPPDDAALTAAFAQGGWTRLAFDADARRLRQPGGLWLDLSGIGKGFAVDALAALLAADGITDALVEIGGELIGRGLRPDGQPWWVDMEAPPGAALPPLRVGLHDLAIATSGDYVRGAHTLDPRTGRPLPPLVASVSVIDRSAMTADAWATALTVLGPVHGAAAGTRENLAVRMIWRDAGRLIEWLSPALQAMMSD